MDEKMAGLLGVLSVALLGDKLVMQLVALLDMLFGSKLVGEMALRLAAQ